MKEMLGDSQHRVCTSLYESSQLKMAAPLKFYATISHIIYPCVHTTAYVHKNAFYSLFFLHCNPSYDVVLLCVYALSAPCTIMKAHT